MKFGIYSIRDELTGFMSLVVEQSDAIAMRNFNHALSMNRDQHLMAWQPSDFTLFKVGEFDNQSGSIFPIIPPQFVQKGEKL